MSPLHTALETLDFEWVGIDGMQAPLRRKSDSTPHTITLADASCLMRVGVKGPGAEQWLAAHGIGALPGVNAWVRTADGVVVARLARTEFFLEDRIGGTTVTRLRDALRPAPGVYPVLRQDAALILNGHRINDLLVQVCNVDFRAWPPEQQAVVMTSMVGVSVLVAWYRHADVPCYRIWCDGTFGTYLWETLLEIAVELGGGAAGLQGLLPGVPENQSQTVDAGRLE
jgi:sarcosine oxidase subunit gamma